jgi:flagellar motor switch/type III secretory pathway protein FliN
LKKSIIDWLPSSSLIDPRVKSLLIAEINGWSQCWFGDRLPFNLIRFEVCGKIPPPKSGDGNWEAAASLLACLSNKKHMTHLAGQILDASDNRFAVSGNDGALLLAVARDAIDDLAQRILVAAGMPSQDTQPSFSVHDMGGIALSIAPNTIKSDHPIRLFVPMAVAAQLRKAIVRSSSQDGDLSGHMADAFGQENIEVNVKLGIARVTAQALCELTHGDVIILDTDIHASFPMNYAQTGQEICRLRLDRGGEETILRVASS